MAEGVFIGLLFAIAIGYLAKKAYGSFRADKGCSKGCGCAQPELKKPGRERPI